MPLSRATGRPALRDLHVGFFLAGMVTTLMGPLVPVLARTWAIPDAVIGSTFSTQFVSSTAVSITSALLDVRFGATRMMSLGFVLMATGVVLVGTLPWPWALAAILLYGCGLGIVLPTTNFLVAAASPGRESAAVSLVNVSWSLGAVTWPLFVGALATTRSVRLPTGLLAVLLLGVVVRFLTSAAAPAPVAATAAAPGNEGFAERRRPVTPGLALLVVIGALLFLYSGSEAATGGWIAEYVRRIDAGARWALAPTIFWGALALGRLATPLLLRLAREPTVLAIGLGTATLASAAIVVYPAATVAIVAVALVGFGLAPAFPITFAALSREVGPTRPTLLGPLYALTGVGSAVIPWTVGFLSSAVHDLRWAMAVPTAGCVVLLVLSLVRVHLTDRARASRRVSSGA